MAASLNACPGLETRRRGWHASGNRNHGGSALSDRLGDLELFAAIAAAGGVSAAALALGSSPPAVSRRLAAMERRLGVRLAQRSARRFRLTDEGRLYAERGRALLAALRDVEAEVSARGSLAFGVLKVGAPMELGRRRIAALVAAFSERHPGVRAHLTLSDSGLEVGQDALDVVLRFGHPREQALIARKLATVRRVLCAAPAYLARRGTPLSLDDLAAHDCLLLTRRHGLADPWRFGAGAGTRAVEAAGRLSSGSGEVLHRWALDGHGISLEAHWDVADDLAAGRLVTVLDEAVSPPLDLYATFQPGQPVPPRIRLFVDFVADRLGHGTALSGP